MDQADEADLPVLVEPAHYVRIDGGTSVVVSGTKGNSTAPINDIVRGTIPGLTIDSLGDTATSIVMDTHKPYTLTFLTVDEPLYLELQTGTGDSWTRAIRYRDLDLPAGVEARWVIRPEGIGVLQYDDNNDGVFESSVTPDVDVRGEAANDEDRPQLVADQQGQGGQTLVSLNAQDAGTGVASISYSLDGTSFQPYAGSIAVDPHNVHTIYAFADDNVGNRSSPFEVTVKVLNVAPVVAPITGSLGPTAVRTAVGVTASFSDANTEDTHTAAWDWGDGSIPRLAP